MRNDTRKKFNHSLAKVAELNGVESAQVQFTVAPAPAQKMEEKIQASSEFLQKINIIGIFLIKISNLLYFFVNNII